MGTEKRLAVVGQNIKLPFIFEEAEAMGIDVVFFHHDEDVVKNGMLPAVSRAVPIPYADGESIKQIVLREYDREPFDGVITTFDPLVSVVAEIAETLGLPYYSRQCVSNCRHKERTREHMVRAFLNVPAYVRIGQEADCPWPLPFPFPAIVKPVTGYSSQGVSRVDGVDELCDAIKKVEVINQETLATFRGDQTGIMIEEFIDGPEYAVETFSHKGDVQVLSIGYKGDGKGPFFEEGVYIAPSDLSRDAQLEVADQVVRTVKAMGIAEGPAHVELRFGSDGRPYVIELGTRVGGSGVSHFIVKNSTGINLFELAFKHVLGMEILKEDINPRLRGTIIGNYIIPVKGSGVFRNIENLEKISKLDNVVRTVVFMEEGHVVKPYPFFSGYPGFIFSKHDSFHECLEFYRYLDKELSIHYQTSR